MEESQAIIERVRRINPQYQQLDLAVDASLSGLRPGQSVLARLNSRWDPYLREHWWPVGIGNNRLVIERPGDMHYEPGQVVNLLGIIGQPYKFRSKLRNVLLIAYDTPPIPLLMTIPMLLSNKVSVTLALLGTAARYTTQHLAPEVEVIVQNIDPQKDAGQENHERSKFEHLEWESSVMTIGWADQVFVAVAPDDEMHRFSEVLAFLGEKRSEIPENYLFGVFRPVLPCGVGACQACMMRLRGKKDKDTALICLDGPALDLTTVQLA